MLNFKQFIHKLYSDGFSVGMRWNTDNEENPRLWIEYNSPEMAIYCVQRAHRIAHIDIIDDNDTVALVDISVADAKNNDLVMDEPLLVNESDRILDFLTDHWLVF